MMKIDDVLRKFDNKSYMEMCPKLGIRTAFASPYHLQANGQVETANKKNQE